MEFYGHKGYPWAPVRRPSNVNSRVVQMHDGRDVPKFNFKEN